jgi:ATP-binding protein involved in chromosome partitioning
VTDAPDPASLVEDVEAVRARTREALAGVERIVAVTSGKGGVGKSAVAVNLAAALARGGRRVGVLDADLHGPSVAKMLGLRGQPVRVGAGDGRLRPVPGPAGLAVQSMDFFLQGGQALDWDGPAGEGAMWRSAIEHAALADLIGRTAWGELECLVIDLAPGSDRLPALASWLHGRFAALAVTIPTEVALLAVERSLRRALDARLPVIGLVENFASVVCATCGAEGELFREAPAEPLAAAMGVELVGRIPFDSALAAAADAGRPYVLGPGAQSPAGRALARLAERVLGYAAFAEDEA